MSTILATITPIATSVIAGCALVLTFRSGQDNRDKLRLDLFNRRFSIYQRTLIFYQALTRWQDTEENEALILPFIEASREALFIFPRESKVYDYLQKFREHAGNITHHKQLTLIFAANDPYRDEETNRQRRMLTDEYLQSIKWILDSIPELEKLMEPWMSFKRL